MGALSSAFQIIDQTDPFLRAFQTYTKGSQALFSDAEQAYSTGPRFTSDLKKHRRSLKHALRVFPEIHSNFQKKKDELLNVLKNKSSIEKFQHEFSDLSSEVIRIFLVHSLGEFDARVLTEEMVSDSSFAGVYFGLDRIAVLHERFKMEDAIFHHELFHFYHFQKTNSMMSSFKGNNPVWYHLWVEGLATYVSHVLNPQAGLLELDLDEPNDLVTIFELNREATILQIENSLEASVAKHSYWFTLPPETGILSYIYGKVSFFGFSFTPIKRQWRAGYYVGYLIAQYLHKNLSISLSDLANENNPVQIRKWINSGILHLQSD